MENTEINKIWTKCLGVLQVQYSGNAFNTIIKIPHLVEITEDTFKFCVPHDYNSEMFLKNSTNISDAIYKITSKRVKIEMEVNYEKYYEDKKISKAEVGPLFENIEKTGNEDYRNAIKSAGLHPDYTFENYLVGNNNQLAFAIATAVAENPGTRYNPFFLYSGVGLGKTHLMQSVGHKILKDNPKTKVVYVQSETFMNQLVESIQKGKEGKYSGAEFRKRYREADVLLIDDIQFIVGRDSTQEEFFHTFNKLVMEGRQIVVTSDRPPKDFVNLEERVTSRLGSGIIADIQSPDIEMREAILRKIREERNEDIPDSAIREIAKSVSSNVRELVGVYNSIALEIKTSSNKTYEEIVANNLSKNVNLPGNKHVSSEEILRTVCKYYNINKKDLKSPSRVKELSLPRQVAMYIMKTHNNTPLMTIGDHLGGRDHTTVMHGIGKIETCLKIQGHHIIRDIKNILDDM